MKLGDFPDIAKKKVIQAQFPSRAEPLERKTGRKTNYVVENNTKRDVGKKDAFTS